MNLPEKSVNEHSSSGRRFGNKKKDKLLRFGHFLLVRGQRGQGDKFSDLSGNCYEKREVYCHHPFLTMRVEELTA